jgi:Cu/Ag efflux pump CusA
MAKQAQNLIKIEELMENGWAPVTEIADAYGLAASTVSKIIHINMDGPIVSYVLPGDKRRWVDVKSFDKYRAETNLATGDVVKLLNSMKAKKMASTPATVRIPRR